MLKFRELLTWFVLRVACFLTTPALKRVHTFKLCMAFGPPPDFRDKISFKEGKFELPAIPAIDLRLVPLNKGGFRGIGLFRPPPVLFFKQRRFTDDFCGVHSPRVTSCLLTRGYYNLTRTGSSTGFFQIVNRKWLNCKS